MSGATALVVDLVVVLGLVVIVPMGLRLLPTGVVPAPTSWAWPVAGACAALALWLPHGGFAVGLAVPFMVAAAVLAAAAARLLLRGVRRRASLPGSAVAAIVTALAMPAVGATALLAEPAGWGLLGFSGTYLTLTVPHMLFAGFGAALVAGLVAGLVARPGTTAEGRRTALVGAWGVPTGTVLVLVGYFVGNLAELAGAVVLTIALWCTAWAVQRGSATGSRPARVLLRAGVVTILLSMLLALWWATGEVTGWPHPSIGQMAATHGVANALGYVLCTLLGFRELGRRGPGEPRRRLRFDSTRVARGTRGAPRVGGGQSSTPTTAPLILTTAPLEENR